MRQYGFRDAAELHEAVVRAAKGGVERLLQKRLNGAVLERLGYSAKALERLGFGAEALERLGLAVPKAVSAPAAAPVGAAGLAPTQANLNPATATVEEIREFVRQHGASELRGAGFTPHHLKKAGVVISDLERAGFTVDQLASVFSCAEMRRAGYTARDLRRFFSGNDLRAANVEAADMRTAGFTIEQLLRFGYNDNQVRTAGFTIADLIRAGLAKQTVDKSRY